MKWISMCIVFISAVNVFASDVSLMAPVLSSHDFAGARVEARNGGSVVEIQLSAEGARKLRDYSAKHVGEDLAIVLDGHVVSAPKLRVPISGALMQVDSFGKEEATQIANAINLSIKK